VNHGGPGVGKDTLINAIPAPHGGQEATPPALRSTAGRQAEWAKPRLEAKNQSTGWLGVRPGSLLPRGGGFFFPPKKSARRAAAGVRICWWWAMKTSMVNVPLMPSLLDAFQPRRPWLLVRDVGSLPPRWGHGRWLADLITAAPCRWAGHGGVRQAATQPQSITTSHAINAAQPSPI